ncbi:MAG: sulfatase-like hydrolase/transferase, partial [Clostridiales bacterium]|nr:sulfatase-like hydrolase/transferase [Clostridiales bacterium]
MLELLNPGSISPVMNLFGADLPNLFIRLPYNEVMSNLSAILFAVGAIYLLVALLYCLCGNVFLSHGLVSLFLYALYIANYYRRLISGLVLSPSELSLAGRLSGVVSLDQLPIDRRVIFTAFALVAGLALLFVFRGKLKTELRKRMVLFSAALAAGLLLFGTVPAQRFLFDRLGVTYISFKMTNNTLYNQCGVMLGFFVSMQSDHIDAIFANDPRYDAMINTMSTDAAAPLERIGAPDFHEKYSEAYMTALVDGIKKKQPIQEKPAAAVEKPNVIVIMSEAFSDPMTWENITFSADPVPNLHALQKNSTHGNVITPEFAGRTCNPEFEFLTGYPMYFASIGDIPFEQQERYIPDDDERALPQIFKKNGYRTIGIHTFEETFYNRDKVYPKLGFDDFISIEDMPNAPLKGSFVSDDYFADKIIAQFEQFDEPTFIFAISMENHFEYMGGKFPALEVTGTSDRFTEEQKDISDSYLQGVHDADKALGKLVAHL